MNNRWAPAFTIVELIIVIAVIAILAVISFVAYNGIQRTAAMRVVQSDLDHVAGEMQRTYQKTGAYPTSIPPNVTASKNITLTVKRATSTPVYSNVSPVQNGMLLAQICQNLVDEGYGKGVNQGGVNTAYITGCGNWNHDSMQFTGWDSKVWKTPLTSAQLLDYANTFTTKDTWNKVQETVVKNFFTELVRRQTEQGGAFPITSFWDSWANSSNGGVMQQPLDSNPRRIAVYCVEAQSNTYQDIVWHVGQDAGIKAGGC